LSDYCHLVNSPCKELYTIGGNEGPSPQSMYLRDNKKWLGQPVPSPLGKTCFLLYAFLVFVYSSSKGLKRHIANDGYPSNQHTLLLKICSHVCWAFPLCHEQVVHHFSEHYASMLHILSLNSWVKERKKPVTARWG